MAHIVGLHHAQVTIPSGAEEQARQFYCGVLGLPEIPKPASLASNGGFWLQVGVAEVHVSLEDGGPNRAATKAHLAYYTDDVAGLRAHLIQAGVATFDNTPIPGYDRFECRDPFGNRLECIGPATRP